ncbi:MAG: hypothetical protein ACTSWZ_05810 [Candidatus Heimdallarchaeaceae archaeon]
MRDKKLIEKLEAIEKTQKELLGDVQKIKTVLDLVIAGSQISNKALIKIIDRLENLENKSSIGDNDVMVV